MNKKLIRKMLTAAGGPLFPWQNQNTELIDNWKFKLTPASRSRVLSGKGVETDKQYTERRKKETTKRTWRSDAADVAHGIGEGVLALNPYIAIPYFGAKVGLDFLNGTYGWHTALNASVPLFHMAPQAVGLREATNVALEDAANAGSKTARNWRVAREIKLKNKSNIEVPKPITRTKVGDVEIDNPGLYYHQSDAGKAKNFVSTGRMRTPLEEFWLAKEEAGEHIPIKIRSGIVPGYPQDPGSAMFAQGNLWYGLTTNKPDLLVTAREMPIANKNASVMSNKASLRQLEAQGTRRVTNDNIYTQGPHNRQNTTAYTWIPGYGYRLVVKEPSTSLKFFERKPSRISEDERLGVPKGERNLPFKLKQPTEHVQGDEAVKMFKEYGGESIPEGSINGELLRKYVAEARERYGLTNNKNITDEEIAQALYKHSKELGGNTAAINSQGEPQLLFRGDTRRYTLLKERMSPEELSTKSGTMDNSLGNLFLGELPGTAGKRTRGLERYLVTGNEFLEKRLEGSGTGSRAVMPDGTFATEWGSTISEFPEGSYHLVTYNTKHGPNTYYKLPSSYSESGVNDINAFVVRTPQMRDASKEISVLNDDFMVKGGPKVEYHGPIRREVLDKDGFPLIVDENGNIVADGLAGSSDRQAMAQHYRYVLNDAKAKKQGLLKSKGETDGEPGNYLRDEHDDYSYFALPNFNIQGAKHLLPYDLRIPRNWKDKNIYRGLIPLTTGYTLYNLLNQPLLKLQYLKQGGKMNKIRKMQTAAGGPIKKPIKRLKDGYRYIPDGNGGWTRISDNSVSDVFATMEFTPKKTKVGSSITRTLQPKTSNYRSAYNPDDIVKGFNILTLGGLNNLSPTQWARRYYDLNQLLISLIPGLKRTMTWSGFVNNWLNGNNGLVSEKFAQEHPYLSTGINGVGDAVALGGLANANKIKLVGDIAAKHGGDTAKIAIDVAKNSSKPFNWRNYRFLGDSRFYSDLDDAGYKTIMAERQSGNYPLTFAERKNYVTGLKGDIQKGVDYAINEAKANLKTPLKLGKEVEYTFDGGRGWRLDPYSPEDIYPQRIHYGTLKATKEYGKTPWEGDYGAFQNKSLGLFFPFRDSPNTLRTHSMFLDVGERISTGAHETRHTIQSYFDVPLTEIRHDMPGTYGRYTNRRLPLDFKKKVNEFIDDALTMGEWEGSLSEMDSELTGWSAKYGFPRYSQMNPKQKALLHDLFLKRFGGNTDYNESVFKLLNDDKILNPYAIKREVKKLDDSKIGQIILGLETLGYRKNGGKMNILEFLKNGNKIKKALWGTDLDVDNRSDTTRQGSGTMPNNAYGAANASNTGGLLSLLDIFNTVKDMGPKNVTLPNGKQITIPGVLTGVAPTIESISPFELSRTASKGERVWKYLFDYVKKHPNVVEPTAPTISKGMTIGNEIGYGLVKLPLEGLTIRSNTPLTLENRVMNPAEKAAAKDYLASRNPKDFEEFPDVIVNTKLPTGRPIGDYKYPQEVLNKYGLKPQLPKKVEISKPKKTSSLRSKEYYSKKVEDKNNGVSKVRSRLILNNKAQTTGDMRAANTGRPRRAARYNDLRTELEKDTGFWGKQYNKIRKKIALGKQGAESKEKEFLESYWNYKQKGILNKEKFGGVLNLLKKGGGIHIKEKNKGKFTSYCGGKVTDECILKGKNSSNPAIRKRATFADNARHFKHKEGGTVKALEGTKFNWGSAIGNLASNVLLLGISTYMLNKKLSSDAEVDKEKYKSEAASKLQKDIQDERTKRFNILNAIKGTSDNPNAFGGGIFENYFINLGDNEAIRNYNQSISDYNKMIDLQIRAQKVEGVGNFLSSLGLLGVGLLANSAFNKNSSASTNTTSSTNTSTINGQKYIIM